MDGAIGAHILGMLMVARLEAMMPGVLRRAEAKRLVSDREKFDRAALKEYHRSFSDAKREMAREFRARDEAWARELLCKKKRVYHENRELAWTFIVMPLFAFAVLVVCYLMGLWGL